MACQNTGTGVVSLAMQNKSHLSFKLTICLLFFILLFGLCRRYDSFDKTGIWHWNFDTPYYVYQASHLSEDTLYIFDERAAVAYRKWFSKVGYITLETFLFYPFQKEEKILSQYAEKPAYRWHVASDTGLIYLFWVAFKLFGDDAPLFAMWQLQLIVDGLVIVLLFLAAQMLLGPMVGLLASFLYAWFPFVHQAGHPIYFPVQTPFYYFWMIPFTVVTLLFWAWVHRFGLKEKPWRYYLLFALFGFFTGFFSMVRSTLLLAIPFVGFFYFLTTEKKLKKRLFLGILLAVLAQTFILSPLVLYNKKVLGSYRLTSRYFWSGVFSGIGFYPNPYRIVHSDNYLVQLARTKFGMKNFYIERPLSFQEVQDFETHFRSEVMEIWEKTPGIFFINALKNLYYAFFLATREDPSAFFEKKYWSVFNFGRLAHPIYSFFYALLLICGLRYAFLLERQVLGGLALILNVGLYLVLSVCALAPPQTSYITGYYLIFYLLLAWGFFSLFQMVFQNKVRKT